MCNPTDVCISLFNMFIQFATTSSPQIMLSVLSIHMHVLCSFVLYVYLASYTGSSSEEDDVNPREKSQVFA